MPAFHVDSRSSDSEGASSLLARDICFFSLVNHPIICRLRKFVARYTVHWGSTEWKGGTFDFFLFDSPWILFIFDRILCETTNGRWLLPTQAYGRRHNQRTESSSVANAHKHFPWTRSRRSFPPSVWSITAATTTATRTSPPLSLPCRVNYRSKSNIVADEVRLYGEWEKTICPAAFVRR